MRWALATVAALLGLTAACSSAPAPTDTAVATRVVEADNGQVTIPADPRRVVAIGYAVPTLLGAGAPLVGVSDFRRALPFLDAGQRATYDALPHVAGDTNTDIDIEAIAQLDPDLIVLGIPKVALADAGIDRLEIIAPVVAFGPAVPSDRREFSRRQADAAGVLAGFETARTAYEARAAELRSALAPALAGLEFAHVGAYGQVARGTFQREFAGSWGTNIAVDIGVRYYGQVRQPGPGSRSVSESPSLEELGGSLREADAITYSVNADGSVPDAVRSVLDSQLWASLPAVQAGRTFPLPLTEATTFNGALRTLDAVAQALAPLRTPRG